MPPTPFPRLLSGPLAWCIPSCFISFDSLSPSRVRVSLRLTSEPFRLPLSRGRNSYISLLPWAPFAGSRRMGTRDALLQIQMGTYANGVTCYYTFPYTNNVLIEPTPYVRRLRGERWAPRFPLLPSTHTRRLLRTRRGAAQVRRGYPICAAPRKSMYRLFRR